MALGLATVSPNSELCPRNRPSVKRKGRFQLKAALLIGDLIGHNEKIIGKKPMVHHLSLIHI